MASIPIIRTILANDDSPTRFENFCIELLYVAENLSLLPTSRTWDLARDGRSISRPSDKGVKQAILCASLNQQIDAKIQSDLERLNRTTKFSHLVYCTPVQMSEHHCDIKKLEIKTLVDGLEVIDVLSLDQLAAYAFRHDKVLRDYYGAELAAVQRALQTPINEGAEVGRIGLRLALMTRTGEDSTALRDELGRRLLLGCLAESGPMAPGTLRVKVSNVMRLSSTFSEPFFDQFLQYLIDDGQVAVANDIVSVTDAGRSVLDQGAADASGTLLEGRTSVRNTIRELSGHHLTDEQMDRIWTILQDGLANLFYYHGSTTIEMVAGILNRGEVAEKSGAVEPQIEQLASRVAEVLTSDKMQEDIRTAVIDMFSEPQYTAFQWFSKVCASYVMLCALGLENVSSREVTDALKNLVLVPDSDILLSLLCEGEPNHLQVERIVRTWREIGGKVVAATPVLEEVAHHAWISHRDFRAISDRIGKTPPQQLFHLISNAFVRAFGSYNPTGDINASWNAYIRQFTGKNNYDYSKIQEVLLDEYGVGFLPSVSIEEASSLYSNVREFLASESTRHAQRDATWLDYKTEDKCRRDAMLLESVLRQREQARGTHKGLAIVVSSAQRLTRAGDEFKPEFGSPEPVASLAAIGYLLTLVPGATLGVGALRNVLFDVSLAARLTPLQRHAFRIIAGSGKYNIPWAKRAALARELGNQILKDAHSRGQNVSEIRAELIHGDDPKASAILIANALAELSIHSDSEQELEELKAENEELRRVLAEMKRDESRKSYSERVTERGKRPAVPRRK
jgi:hypothetical protein